jgi:Flp pilus assembly protein TadG
MRNWLRLLDDRSGAAAVEFALLGGTFLLLVVAIFEFSTAMMIGSTIESATLVASRYGITGADGSGKSRDQEIIAQIQDRLGILGNLVDPASLTISTKVYKTYGDIGNDKTFSDGNNNGKYEDGEAFQDKNNNGKWDGGTPGNGGPNDIVVYRVDYTSTSLTQFMSSIIGELHHSASVVVKNEPY